MDLELQAERQPSNGNDKEREIETDLTVLVTLRRERPMCWMLMPQTIQHIKEFCRKYDTDSDPEKLAESVQINFASGNPGVLIIVIVQRYKIVGHLLATMDEWFGKKFVTVLQYERDGKSAIDTEVLRAGLATVEDWGRKQGAQEMQILVACPKLQQMARNAVASVFSLESAAFELFYGFTPHRLQMRKTL